MKQEQEKETRKVRGIDIVKAYLNSEVAERGELIDICLSAMLTGDHVFMLGPPGVAKTFLAEKLTEFVSLASNTSLFTFQFNKDTKADDLFGSFDINEFRGGKYKRNTSGFLPTANVAVLDEIWKGGIVLNSLLRVLNERKFRNGDVDEDVPLRFAIASSNELPEDSSLNALYDRFLWRVEVDYIEDTDTFVDLAMNKLNRFKSNDPLSFISNHNIDPSDVSVNSLVNNYNKMITTKTKYAFSRDLVAATHRFAKLLRQNNIAISDRRLFKALEGARALSYVRSRQVTTDIFYSMVNMIWFSPEEKNSIRKIIIDPNNNFLTASARNSFNYIQSIDLVMTQANEKKISPSSAFAELKKIEKLIYEMPTEDKENDLYAEALQKATKAIIQMRSNV